jgi:mannose-1-phosphate guanylyltransferase
MRAVVLVGGFGTRLRPLTNHTPKSMLPVGHEPMICRLVGRLVAGGVTEVTLALGFKAGPFLEAFPDGMCAGAALRYAVEPEPLDTAGAIRFAAEHAGIDETFVVVNGDIITDLDVSRLVSTHRSTGAEGTIHLTPVDDPSAYGVLELDGDGRVQRFLEKPEPGTTDSDLINAGTYVLEPSVLHRIAPERKVSIERDTFPEMVDAGTLYALPTDDYWIDTGRPEPYLRANVDYVNGCRPEQVEPCAPGSVVDPTAVLVDALVEPEARVEAGARLVESVVLSGARVGREAVLERSIVMGAVGAGATVRDAVIGSGGDVPAGATLVDVRLPSPD